jgi:hypothetical protein
MLDPENAMVEKAGEADTSTEYEVAPATPFQVKFGTTN